jgi:uncharacterized protein (DUF1697 family)
MTQGYVALLRGVNVGGARPLPMERLRALFAEAGANSVESFIQSGNVVFAATEAQAPQILADVSARIRQEFGFAAPIVLRDATAWQTLIDSNPFLGDGADPNTLHALCLSETPSREALDRLDPRRSPGDEFEVRGRDIYLRLPSGVARTKLTNAWFDSKLRVTSTLRNWRTVLKLGELVAALGRQSGERAELS